LLNLISWDGWTMYLQPLSAQPNIIFFAALDNPVTIF
jgi:hypothetical protein